MNLLKSLTVLQKARISSHDFVSTSARKVVEESYCKECGTDTPEQYLIEGLCQDCDDECTRLATLERNWDCDAELRKKWNNSWSDYFYNIKE